MFTTEKFQCDDTLLLIEFYSNDLASTGNHSCIKMASNGSNGHQGFFFCSPLPLDAILMYKLFSAYAS